MIIRRKQIPYDDIGHSYRRVIERFVIIKTINGVTKILMRAKWSELWGKCQHGEYACWEDEKWIY